MEVAAAKAVRNRKSEPRYSHVVEAVDMVGVHGAHCCSTKSRFAPPGLRRTQSTMWRARPLHFADGIHSPPSAASRRSHEIARDRDASRGELSHRFAKVSTLAHEYRSPNSSAS